MGEVEVLLLVAHQPKSSILNLIDETDQDYATTRRREWRYGVAQQRKAGEVWMRWMRHLSVPRYVASRVLVSREGAAEAPFHLPTRLPVVQSPTFG